MKRFLLSFTLLASLLPAETIDFSLLPGPTINGTAGSTIGWGYTVTNNSPDQWLVFFDVNTDPFVSATPNALFDYPILSPGETVAQAYNSSLGTGLFELTWDSFLPSTVKNTGNFVLDAQWWNGDPLTDGTYVSDADPILRAYTAIGSPAQVPEPSMIWLVGSALSAIAWKRMRSKRSEGRG